MRFIILLPLALAGCVTSLVDVRTREVQDDVVTAQPLPAVRECLLERLASLGRQPFVNGTDQKTEVAFSTEAAGVIFHYTLTAVAGGTRVEARRKNNIANGFNSGRKCYAAGS